ncbi:uncharacterized protein JN550_013780 [Neoarthrinium moseri]|uniref:uncharacterized protein n=1 Tax=Neoarthrinium moseri TaxID=1658444 RepID=UPI001FDBCC94|nr:uncharacterized protein JN550_013780 [Neoarthrinium moseri]KAI1856497.1 hypothetical protein JN550_013780 [Neoarthrinium moseri]
MTYIVRGLTLEEIYDLSRSCRHFQYLIREENLCKMLLRDKAAYSVEAEDALETGEFARGFRRLVKRRRAIASASPYVAAVVAVADSFAFHNGRLCYLVEDRANARRDLRILDVQKATNHELVVDVPTLVSLAVPESAGCRKYTFRVLYHAAGITSCLYSFARPNTQHWLLIFNAERQQLLGAVQLESAMRLFVRNNRDHLIFGTHSERQANGIRKWALRHFDLRTGQLAAESMHLTNVVGYEIGSTVCFEIIGNHFYGCSNSTAFELEEIDWTSHYYCFRFAVDDFDPEKTQIMKKRDAWRRQHAEGPIDDRWTFLNLEQDEQTGSVRIIESRKEWLNGRSGSKRTYYITNTRFPDASSTDGDGTDDNDPLPNEPLARLLTSSNQPNYMVAPQRDAHAFHRGDDGSITFSKGKTYLSTYHQACSTYLDLVDDPLPGDICMQRLRIRTGTRVSSNASSVVTTQNSPSGDYCVGNPYIEDPESNTIHFWPPEACCDDYRDHDDKLQRLDQVMNPRGLTGNVVATGDGRSIIFSTTSGNSSDLKVLVYLTFDPSVRLAGTVQMGRLDAKDINSSCHLGQNRDVAGCPRSEEKESDHAANGCPRGRHEKQESAASLAISGVPSSPWQDYPVDTLPAPKMGPYWATLQDAMHLSFSRKLGFAFNRNNGSRTNSQYSS